MRRATTVPPEAATGRLRREAPAALRAHRSPRMWAMYCDMEESLGTIESAKIAYDKVSGWIIRNYALIRVTV